MLKAARFLCRPWAAAILFLPLAVLAADRVATPEPPGEASLDWAPADTIFGTAGLTPLRDLAPERLRKTLENLKPDPPPSTRGAKEEQVYIKVSPAVVLVVTNDAFGSGSVLNAEGLILTNYHVVQGHETVAVAFKPVASTQLTRSALVSAKVIKFDLNADLALIKVVSPPRSLTTIPLGDLADVNVGSDVHAIGHPTGEMWTYTKGLVSQIRPNYEWKASDRDRLHHATVIQTQTPINPGNSGGPLISDSGKLIGVNTFRSQGEGLNFAVAVDEVSRFLARPDSPAASSQNSASTCKIRSTKRVADKKWKGFVTKYDTNCDGKVDAILVEPFDQSKPIVLYRDSKYSGKWDVVFFDDDRDGKLDRSTWLNDDGTCRIIGIHDTGTLEPTRWIACPSS